MRRASLPLLLALVTSPGCGDRAAPSITSLELQPSSATIAELGATQKFLATALLSDGTTADVTAAATWSSSNEWAASITGGMATALAAGTTTITARHVGSSASASLKVTNGARFVIQVTPPTATITVGESVQYTATANYDDGTSTDVTTAASWTSGDETIAKVQKGLATGLKPGTAVITADVNGIKATAVVIVPNGVKSVEVTPAAPTIVKGTTQQFQADAILQDNTKQNVTGQVTWASATTVVATIDATGLATGIAAGTSTIVAVLGTIKGSTTLTVTGVQPGKVEVTPVAATATVGGANVNFTATAVFNPTTTQNVTTTATWTSSNTSVATIDPTGVAKSLTAGTTKITAAYQGKTSAPATLIVTGPVVVSIAVTPANVTIVKGTTQQFKAEATMSDTTQQDMTSAVSWQSSDVSAATIAPGGLATGVSAGTTKITASYGGVISTTPAVLTVW